MDIRRLYKPFSVNVETIDVYTTREEEQHFFELTYILNGKGKQHVNNNVFNYKEGDLLLYTPSDLHFFEIEVQTTFFFLRFNNFYIKSDAIQIDNIKRLEFVLKNAKNSPGSIITSRTDKALVSATVKSIIEETVDKELYNTEIVQQLVNTLIIIVARNIAKGFSERVNENTDSRIIEILNYIQSNIYNPEKLRTKVISEHFNISQNYLGRYFKKHCQETLQDYITNCKVSLIENRLIHSDKRINEIVTEFGFTDESHLNKFFKQQKGITPSMYRNNTGSYDIEM